MALCFRVAGLLGTYDTAYNRVGWIVRILRVGSATKARRFAISKERHIVAVARRPMSRRRQRYLVRGRSPEMDRPMRGKVCNGFWPFWCARFIGVCTCRKFQRRLQSRFLLIRETKRLSIALGIKIGVFY